MELSEESVEDLEPAVSLALGWERGATLNVRNVEK